MCGITGYILNKSTGSTLSDRLNSGGLLPHRGPDSFGVWFDKTKRVGLQHYRLSILDLSSLGSQPMSSKCGRLVIVFNGEIYNHLELREELSQYNSNVVFRSGSDTETLIECIAAWGVSKTLNKIVGMFAFALFDNDQKLLTICRDRFGEKPLYYGYVRGNFYFASELKVFKSELKKSDVNSNSIATYLRYGYVTGINSIYKDIYRLSPGSMIHITLEDVHSGVLPEQIYYWDIRKLVEQYSKFNYTDNANQTIYDLNKVLNKSVSDQMISDVSIGALLSGGIDSSLIVSLMQNSSTRRIKTYTVGFQNQINDEAPHAKRIAKYLNTDHTELYVSESDILGMVPRLSSVYCEPIGDSSALPTLMVMQLASQDVKVVLTGDGGDELFGGYDRYYRVQKAWSTANKIPLPLRNLLTFLLGRAPDVSINNLIKFLPKSVRVFCNSPDRFLKILQILPSKTIEEMHLGLITCWDPAKIVPNVSEYSTIYSQVFPSASSTIERMMVSDLLCYLPDDLMTKVDRAAMAVSIEARAPFLDHRVAEFAWRLPIDKKAPLNQPKWILKKLLEQYLPAHLFDRPKQGFGMPIDEWLRGPLSSWAKSLINDKCRDIYFIDSDYVNKIFEEHMSRRRDWGHKIWPVLMLISWFESL